MPIASLPTDADVTIIGLPKLSLDSIDQEIMRVASTTHPNAWICGDHCETPSIQGAMNSDSGLRVANEIQKIPSG